MTSSSSRTLALSVLVVGLLAAASSAAPSTSFRGQLYSLEKQAAPVGKPSTTFPMLTQDLGFYLLAAPMKFNRNDVYTFAGSVPDQWRCGNAATVACLTDGNLAHHVDPRGYKNWVDLTSSPCGDASDAPFGVCSFSNTGDLSFTCGTLTGDQGTLAWVQGVVSGVAPDLSKVPSGPPVVTFEPDVTAGSDIGLTRYLFTRDWQTVDQRSDMLVSAGSSGQLSWSCSSKAGAAIQVYVCNDGLLNGDPANCIPSNTKNLVSPVSPAMANPGVIFKANAGQTYRAVVTSAVGSDYTTGATPTTAASVRCVMRSSSTLPTL